MCRTMSPVPGSNSATAKYEWSTLPPFFVRACTCTTTSVGVSAKPAASSAVSSPSRSSAHRGRTAVSMTLLCSAQPSTVPLGPKKTASDAKSASASSRLRSRSSTIWW